MAASAPSPAQDGVTAGKGDGLPHLGVDLGGTKIEVALLWAPPPAAGPAFPLSASPTPRGESRVLRARCPTPQGDYDGTLAAMAALVRQVEQEAGIDSACPVGLGIPGSLSPVTGLVRNANATCLNGRPLGEDAQAVLRRPVRLENDANCLTVSEAYDGAGADAAAVFGVILGTGVGGGFVHAGRLIRGRNALTGEWGHTPLPFPALQLEDEPALGPSDAEGAETAPSCYCGRRGCIETFLSGPALVAAYHRYGGAQAVASVEGLVAAASEGERRAAQVLDQHRRRLAIALAQIVNILDPDVIVLGGGVSNLPGLVEALPALMQPHVFSDCFATPLRRARHGDSSGVLGAARLWAAPDAARDSARRNATVARGERHGR